MWIILFQCLEGLKRKYLEKEDRVKSLASLDDMHSKLEELKNQMAWALVRGSSIPSKYESKSVFILFVYLSGVMHNRYIVADLATQLNT